MKTISIERVSNGWIVRPFSACTDWPVGRDTSAIAVFTEMAAMQAALPQFFEMPDPLVPVKHDNPYDPRAVDVSDGPRNCP